eukprot:2885897-Amphidinium_carterae.1
MFGLQKSASFEHEIYGDVAANTLSILYQRRVLQIYASWVSADSPASFTGITVPKLLQSEDETRQLEGLPPRGKARMKAIVSMRPTGAIEPAT